jgi:hypothetical protein
MGMAGIVLSSPNVQEVFDLARKWPVWTARCAKWRRFTAPHRHRSREYAGGIVRLLVKAGRKSRRQQALRKWAAQFKLRGDCVYGDRY